MKKLMFVMLCVGLGLVLCGTAQAALLAGYEPGETVVAGTQNSNDCVVTPVLASSVGLTATQGDYILAINIANCADGKVEFDNLWTAGSYSTIGQTAIVFDLHLPTGSVNSFSVIGYWDQELGWAGNWAPTVSQGAWQTINYNITDTLFQTASDTQIWAMVFEGMNMNALPVNTTIYIDNLRTIPEPVTMALMGLGSLFLARRRK